MVYNDYVRAYIVLIEASTQYLYTASIYECLRTITNWNDFKKNRYLTTRVIKQTAMPTWVYLKFSAPF